MVHGAKGMAVAVYGRPGGYMILLFFVLFDLDKPCT